MTRTADLLGGGWARIERRRVRGSGAGVSLDINLGGGDGPENVPQAPDVEPLKLRYYSRIARPPLPDNWTAADYLEYAASQIEQSAFYLDRAQRSAQHVEGHPIQRVASDVDSLLDAYDTGVMTLIQGFEKAGDPKVYAKAAMDVLLKLQPYLRAVPSVMAVAINTGAKLGYQIGFADGFIAGWDARDKDTSDIMQYLKKLLATAGVGIAVVAALVLAALALSR